MKKTKGLALATAALMLAGGLAACNKDGGDAGGNTDKSTTSTDAAKDNKNSDAYSDKGKDDKTDMQAASDAAADFYNTMFSDPLPGGMETFQKLSDEMNQAVGDSKEVFSAPNPREAIGGLPKDKQEALLAVVEKYGNVKELVNYDQLGIPDKVLSNMVSIMFRLVSASGIDGSKVKFTVDPALLKKEGNEVVVPTNAFTATSGDKSSNEVVPTNLYVVKVGNSWRVDGAKLVDGMMSQDDGAAKTPGDGDKAADGSAAPTADKDKAE